MVWIFTFGIGHPHANRYVRIEGDSATARREMFRRFGTRWSHQYTVEEFGDDAERYGLTELVEETS